MKREELESRGLGQIFVYLTEYETSFSCDLPYQNPSWLDQSSLLWQCIISKWNEAHQNVNSSPLFMQLLWNTGLLHHFVQPETFGCKLLYDFNFFFIWFVKVFCLSLEDNFLGANLKWEDSFLKWKSTSFLKWDFASQELKCFQIFLFLLPNFMSQFVSFHSNLQIDLQHWFPPLQWCSQPFWQIYY